VRLTGRVTTMERRAPGRGCRVCREWQAEGLACVPSEEADDPDAWERYLPHAQTCPHCGREVIRVVKVLVGVGCDASILD